ncbi:MAG: c-type cytochrome domain-containing protein, partial [Planctomycetaceae bacterium]
MWLVSLWLGALWLAGLCANVGAADPPATNAALLFPEVRAIVQTRCLKCHGPLKPEGQLQLGTPLGLARGGESGPAVVPGHLADSLLWQRVAAGEMPPDAPLPQAEQQRLRDWILAGAPGLPPAPREPLVGADHWAFQPLLRPAVPVNPARDGEATAIDAFIRRELLTQGLEVRRNDEHTPPPPPPSPPPTPPP